MEVHDNLKVKILEAENLLTVRGLPPSSYVTVTVGPNTLKTREIRDTCHPKYGEAMLIFDHILGDNVQSILVYIYHYDPSEEHQRCLGMVIIPMDTFYNAPKISFVDWYELLPGEKGDRLDNSRIKLEIEYDHAVDDELFTPKDGVQSKAPNFLQATILSASSLPFDTPIEACVEIKVDSFKKSSKVSKRSDNPAWNETLELPAINPESFVDILLKQVQVMRSVVIGRARIPLNEIAAAGESGYAKTLVLYGEQLDMHRENNGELEVLIRWIFDAETEQLADRVKNPKPSFTEQFGRLFRKKISSAYKNAAASTVDEDSQRTSLIKKDGYTSRTKEEHYRISQKALPSSDMTPGEIQQHIERQRERRFEEADELLKSEEEAELMMSEMKEGDYTIMVTVVELDQLVGMNASGLSDPFVEIEVKGQTYKTQTKYQCSQAVYDETFYFNFKDLKFDELNDISIKFSVYSRWRAISQIRQWKKSDGSRGRLRDFGSTLMGVYQVDLRNVYACKDHEMYKRWAALRDPENDDDMEPQGLLKYSVVALGPEDNQRIHDPAMEQEEEEEHDADIKEGIAIPDFNQGSTENLQFLVISVIRVEGLKGFDRLLTNKKSLYSYVQAEFAGCRPVKTSKLSVSGQQNLTIVFEEELWIPVWVPTMCKRIALRIMNKEFFALTTSNKVMIASAYIDFDDVQRCETNPITSSTYNGPALQWIHFYGADPRVKHGPKQAKFMNKFPKHASAYRGSLLVSMRRITNPASMATSSGGGISGLFGSSAHHAVAPVTKVEEITYSIPDTLVPANAKYRIKGMIYLGTDFGSKGKQESGKSHHRYALAITIGQYEVRTQFRSYVDGIVKWTELLELANIQLPDDYKQLPDVFITIYKASSMSLTGGAAEGASSTSADTNNYTSFAFLRLKAKKLIPIRDPNKKTRAGDSIQQPIETRWYELQHDLSHKTSMSKISYPGSILCKLSLANMEDAIADKEWEKDRRKLEIVKPYALRICVYQCKSLPSVDETGLIDPYIKIRFAGDKVKTSVKPMTKNPCYYEVFDFHKTLPEDLSLAPTIVIQLWDNKFVLNTPVAAVRISPSAIPLKTNMLSLEAPKPQWYDFYGIDNQKKLGKILLAFQLFQRKDEKQYLSPATDITPKMRKAYLDIHTIGIRNLIKSSSTVSSTGSSLAGHGSTSALSRLRTGNKAPRQGSKIWKPFITYNLTEGRLSDSYRIILNSSKTPSPQNPNFLDRKIQLINIPEDPMFAPSLEILVYDEYMTGPKLLACCEVDLSSKLIWNSLEYVPPRQHDYMKTAIENRKNLEKKREQLALTNGNKGGSDGDGTPTPGGTKKKKGEQIVDVEVVGDLNDDSFNEDVSKGKRKKVIDSGVGVFPILPEEDEDEEGDSKDTDKDRTRSQRNGGRLGYRDLPLIQDEDEERIIRQRQEAERRRQQQLDGLDETDRRLEDMGLGSTWMSGIGGGSSGSSGGRDEAKELIEMNNHINKLPSDMKKKIGIPTAWTSSNYLKGREKWIMSKVPGEGGELEKKFPYTTFELYDLKCGHIAFNKIGKRKDTIRKIGTLKAVIRVTTSNPRLDEDFNQFAKQLRQVMNCKVRVYVIKGLNLQSNGWLDNPDPYLVLTLGDVMKSHRSEAENDTNNPEFGSYTEFDTKLPGPSKLKISVMDKNMVFDYPLGETEVDLEDRWFHPSWIELGDTKPLELRNLYRSTAASAQGSLLMWLDIFTQSEAMKIPPVILPKSEKRKFEIRIVCWRSMDVHYKNRRALDLVSTFYMEGDTDKKRSTDVHWRCKTGQGSWNYRIKLAIELPIESKEKSRLKVQLWNQSLIRSSEIIGEQSVNLYDWFLLAYRRGAPVQPFKEIKDAMKTPGGFSTELVDDDDQDDGDDGNDDDNGEDDVELADMDIAAAAAKQQDEAGENEDGDNEDGEDEGDIESQPLLKESKKQPISVTAAPLKSGKSDGKGSVSSTTTSRAGSRSKKVDDEDDEDMNDAVSGVQQFFGMGTKIAEDAMWLKLTAHDKKAKKVVERGMLAVSISIVPESEFTTRPVGNARDEPNVNPYLPPPMGRMSFSLNPLTMISELFGPKVLCLILCICCCAVCIASFAFISVYLSGITSTITLVKSFF